MSFAFGEARTVDPFMTSIALISTVAYLAACEYFTTSMEHYLQDSPVYTSMLKKIYRELMIIGIVSFSLVMYQAIDANQSDLVHEWILVFDYVGYVLFFNVIFFVVHAIAIIIWSVQASTQYNLFHSTSITNILQSINEIKNNPLYRLFYESNYNPILPKPRQMAEFKVIHVLFRDVFGIPENFEFGEYLGKCFERYSLNIIHLSMTSWIIMIVLYGLNLVRIFTVATVPFVHCQATIDHRRVLFSLTDSLDYETPTSSSSPPHSPTNDTLHSSYSSHGAGPCDETYLRLFCSCAILLVGYVLFLLFLGRVYTLRLLRKCNVEGIHGVDDDLLFFLTEQATQELEKNDKTQKKAVDDDIILLHRGNPRRMSINSFSRKIERIKTTKSSKHPSSPKKFGKPKIDPMPKTNTSPPVHFIPAIAQKVAAANEKKREQLESMQKGKNRALSSGQVDDHIKLTEDFSDIYAFQSPTLYFRAVEIGIVLNCLFMSLWLSDFIYIASLSDNSAYYQFVMSLPLLLVLPLLIQTIKTASLLAAIASLDVEVIGEVLEETHERDTLIEELRQKITRRTYGSHMSQSEMLQAAFHEIDTDGSGEINKKEFQALLVQMDMCYSGKRFHNLYHAIDRNNDGSLSIEELNHILFPQTAKEQEVESEKKKVITHIQQTLTSLEEEVTTDEKGRGGNVTLKHHTKRLMRISTLKTLNNVTKNRENSGATPNAVVGEDKRNDKNNEAVEAKEEKEEEEEDDDQEKDDKNEKKEEKEETHQNIPPPSKDMKVITTATQHQPQQQHQQDNSQEGQCLTHPIHPSTSRTTSPLLHEHEEEKEKRCDEKIPPLVIQSSPLPPSQSSKSPLTVVVENASPTHQLSGYKSPTTKSFNQTTPPAFNQPVVTSFSFQGSPPRSSLPYQSSNYSHVNSLNQNGLRSSSFDSPSRHYSYPSPSHHLPPLTSPGSGSYYPSHNPSHYPSHPSYPTYPSQIQHQQPYPHSPHPYFNSHAATTAPNDPQSRQQLMDRVRKHLQSTSLILPNEQVHSHNIVDMENIPD